MPRKPGKRGWGEGSITELGPGRWRARLPGKERASKVLPSLAEARAWVREQLGKRDRGQAVAGNGQTLGEWYAGWIAEKRSGTEDGTHTKYEQHFRVHILPRLGDTRLRGLTADAVKGWARWLVERRVSKAMRRKVMTTLTVCLNSAVKGNKLAANPMDAVERPKHKPPEVEVYTPAECRSLLAALPPGQLGPLFRLLLDAGCRPAEALALTWADLDPAASRVKLAKSLQELPPEEEGGERFKLKATKTAAGNRQVRIAPDTLSSLTALRASRPTAEAGDRGRVFAGDGGGWLSYFKVEKAWGRLTTAAGVPRHTLYALRHTSASLLLAGGVSIRTVSRRLGHETVEMTLRVYAHLMPDADDRAAEVLAGFFGTRTGQAGGGQTGGDPTQTQD
jgi:integrase